MSNELFDKWKKMGIKATGPPPSSKPEEKKLPPPIPAPSSPTKAEGEAKKV